MPNINSLAEVLAQPDWPYHYQYDNLPLRQILLREDMINAAVDAATQILADAKGTATDLATRLGVSMNPDGTLKSSAIPPISIEDVADNANYVRMTTAERSKLSMISAEATSVGFGVNAIVTNENINSAQMFKLVDTTSIAWLPTIDPEGDITAQAVLITPTPVIPNYDNSANTTDYKNYTIGLVIVPNSLRVYVNGVRVPLFPTTVIVPSTTNISVGYWADSSTFIGASSGSTAFEWIALGYTPGSDPSLPATFQLSQSLDSSYLVQVDYNRSN